MLKRYNRKISNKIILLSLANSLLLVMVIGVASATFDSTGSTLISETNITFMGSGFELPPTQVLRGMFFAMILGAVTSYFFGRSYPTQ